MTGPSMGGVGGPAQIRGDAPEYRVEALAKGLRVLSLFSKRRPTWRLVDIAATLDMPLTSVYRVAMTLAADGYLEQLPDGDYRPSVRVLTLGTSALTSLDLVEIATPRLQALARTTGHTVNFGVLTGDQVLFLIRLRSPDVVTTNIQVGSTMPAVHTSIGKLLLAQLDDDALAERIQASSFSAGQGPHARLTLHELRLELAQVRRDGWAVQDEELAFGLRSVAAGVFDASGSAVAAANVAVRAREWPRARVVDELRPMVLRCCAEISGLLGHCEPAMRAV